MKGADDRDHRPIRSPETPDRRPEVDLHPEVGEDLARPLSLAPPADPPRKRLSDAPLEGQVLNRVQGLDQRQVLVDEVNLPPPLGGVAVARQARLFAEEPHPGLTIGPVVTSQELDQGRLPRAILTEQAMHLPDPEIECHVAEGGLPSE